MYDYQQAHDDLHEEVTEPLARAVSVTSDDLKTKKLRVPDEFSIERPSDICLMTWCRGCEQDFVTDCSQLYCGTCTVKEFCDFCEQCDGCCECPERVLLGKVEELVRQADGKLLEEVYKQLTHTVTFEYRGYRKLVSVDIICDGTVKWFVKGKQYWVGGKEVSATLDNLTLEEVLDSQIGEELNLIHDEVLRGLGWHDAGTFWGLPPHVLREVDRIIS